MNGWIIGILIVAAVMYIGGPLLIFFTQRMKGRPEMRTLTEADLPPQLTNYLYSTAASLREDGFRSEIYLTMPNPVPNVQNFLILMTNRETGDKAMVTVIIGGQGSIDQLTAYVEFSTRFASGRVYNTMNSAMIGAFDPGPQSVNTQLWEVQDPHLLYRIHRHLIISLNPPPPGDTPEMFEEGTVMAFIQQRVLLGSFQEEVNRGILRPIGAGDDIEFAPTLYGAFKMTYRMLPPFAGILRSSILDRARAVLRSFQEAEAARTA